MKYLILIYRGPDDDGRTADTEHAALVRDLAGGGELIAAEALADPAQTRRPPPAVTAGPVCDEPQLSAFYLVECETVDCALAHAARVPESAVGRVEVRPVLGRGGLEM
ncbi:YciI family protein [Jiangella anatolica]|uniref:YCII-related domain-containing protein n=1 Tax=Jiangella anatolica TaxID=2670374 RepID=A0A2W2BVH9_9ACTN|nr:YciI family protein [Jiangella anatolica]PZF80169.1 hypothetical protein C1I92_27480 [Jiangella anatolica]